MVYVGKTKGKRLLGRTRCREEDNITTDLQDVFFGAWTRLTWFRIGTVGGHLLMW
jgi:hypothetical protein